MLFILTTLCPRNFAQSISAEAIADTNNVLIGDQIRLTFRLKVEGKANVIWPSIGDTIGKIEIIDRTKIDTLDTNNTKIQTQILTVTSFDSGIYEIPPFIFMYEKEGFTSLFPVSTNPLVLHFSTVAIDTTKPIKDIKAVIKEPLTLAEILWYAAIAAAIAALIAAVGTGIYFIWFRKKSDLLAHLRYDPKIPAHVAALEALKNLDDMKLWQKGQVKLYHVRLSEIIRLYIERRFEIFALEMVSYEIIEALIPLHLPGDNTENLKKMFLLSDLVKFAKLLPMPNENSACMTWSVAFVKATIPVDSLKENNQKEGVS